jgi:hypothetical protein
LRNFKNFEKNISRALETFLNFRIILGIFSNLEKKYQEFPIRSFQGSQELLGSFSADSGRKLPVFRCGSAPEDSGILYENFI